MKRLVSNFTAACLGMREAIDSRPRDMEDRDGGMREGEKGGGRERETGSLSAHPK